MHHQRHQTTFRHFIKENLAWLNVIPMAFFSVNPAMLDKNHEARAEANNLSIPFSKKLD